LLNRHTVISLNAAITPSANKKDFRLLPEIANLKIQISDNIQYRNPNFQNELPVFEFGAKRQRTGA
jgi:hypothetical protein